METVPAEETSLVEKSASRTAGKVYLALVKPWIIGLVLVATLGGMFIAGKTMPPGALAFWTLLGIGLATAAAAALNNGIDVDIDSRMKRTSQRPTASGAIDQGRAFVTGAALTVAAIVVMSLGTNQIASSLTLASIFFYVVIYTYCMKRTTPLATFVGGIAGALPPVIGYAAVNPAIGVDALALFLILYAWQHPHFWALALKYRHDYAYAGVKNLPVASGVHETKKQMVVWAAILMAVSGLPYILGFAGLIYLTFAMFTGLVFFFMTLLFFLSTRTVDMKIFFYSVAHLSTLFCVMVIDLT